MTDGFWGLTPADLAVIVLYFAATFAIAWRAMKRVRTQEDFFLGGRRFGKLIQSFAAFGQATSVESVTTTTTVVNTSGAAGIWGMLCGGVFIMPILWMSSVWYRRLRLLTLADFFEERYGSKRMAGFFALCQTLFFVLVAAIGLTAMSKTVAAVMTKPVEALNSSERMEYEKALEREKLESADYAFLGIQEQNRLQELRLMNPRKEFSYVNENYLIAVVAMVTLLYASAGGLAAAFMTDLIQGLLILVLTVLLIPFAAIRVNELHGTTGFLGAFEAMHKVLPASMFDLWGRPDMLEFTWFWIAAFAVLTIMNTLVQANQLTACGAAKDDLTARQGFVTGIFMKRYANVIWGLVAMFTLVLYGGAVKDPDYVWGRATRDLLGPLGLGLVGLMIACLMAALMAAKSAMMLTTSALVTRNLYYPFVPQRSEAHYVWAGRAFSALYMLASMWTAMAFNNIFGLFKMMVMFNSILAAAFLLGMLWRPANRAGAWASMLVMFVATVLLPFGLPLFPGVRGAEALQKTTRPLPVARTYTAREMDVQQRGQAVEHWDRLHAVGKAEGARPAPIRIGEKFDKSFSLPAKSIFWSEGLKVLADGENGSRASMVGQGYLKVELVALDWLGWDLSRNSYALNETLTLLFRIVAPVLVLMLVSAFTRPEPKPLLDLFYARMRTPVRGSHEDDDREMALTRADPRRFDRLKLFPNSSWEFRKWDREDILGIAGCCFGAAGVFALLILIVNLGG
jgi:solute:Na+ symporter, SSS family